MDLLLALISLVMTSSGLEAFETHRRICHSNEVDVGIRKASWEPVAIHTCVPGPRTHECFAIGELWNFRETQCFNNKVF